MQTRLLLPGAVALILSAQLVIAQNPATSPSAGTSRGQAGPHPHRQLPKPTNLKVLPKDTTPQELDKIMHGFTGSLGVKCNFCHAANAQTHQLDFASDAKDDKGIARTMMEMTRTINDQFMVKVQDPDAMPEDKHVTCATCHRGHSMPEHFMPPPEGHHQPPAGAPQPPQ